MLQAYWKKKSECVVTSWVKLLDYTVGPHLAIEQALSGNQSNQSSVSTHIQSNKQFTVVAKYRQETRGWEQKKVWGWGRQRKERI